MLGLYFDIGETLFRIWLCTLENLINTSGEESLDLLESEIDRGSIDLMSKCRILKTKYKREFSNF